MHRRAASQALAATAFVAHSTNGHSYSDQNGATMAAGMGGAAQSRRARRHGPTGWALENVRDLGGTPVRDGAAVRPGVLVRSSEPVPVSSETTAPLVPAGMICDLRSRKERALQGGVDPPYPGVPVLHVEMMSPENAAGSDTARRILGDPSGRTARAYMLETYRTMPGFLLGGGLEAFVRRLVLPRSAPALVHCRAGKDRTGVFCAILLVAMGADRDTVTADYMLSDRVFGTHRLLQIVAGHGGVDPESLGAPEHAAVDPMRVRPEYLHTALDAVESRWSGMDAYLAAAGLAPDDVARLRARLIT